MQATSAVRFTLIWSSSPSPATLPATVSASPERLMVGVPTVRAAGPCGQGRQRRHGQREHGRHDESSHQIPLLRTGASPAS